MDTRTGPHAAPGPDAAPTYIDKAAIVRLTEAARRRRAQDPEGIAQQVAAEYLQRAAHLHFTTEAEAWAYLSRAVTNRVIDEARRRDASPIIAPSDVNVDLPATSFEERVVNKIWVEGALQALNPDQRKLIYLHYFRGLGIPEIAEAEAVTIEAARSRVRRSLAALAAALGLTAAFICFALHPETWLPSINHAEHHSSSSAPAVADHSPAPTEAATLPHNLPAQGGIHPNYTTTTTGSSTTTTSTDTSSVTVFQVRADSGKTSTSAQPPRGLDNPGRSSSAHGEHGARSAPSYGDFTGLPYQMFSVHHGTYLTDVNEWEIDVMMTTEPYGDRSLWELTPEGTGYSWRNVATGGYLALRNGTIFSAAVPEDDDWDFTVEFTDDGRVLIYGYHIRSGGYLHGSRDGGEADIRPADPSTIEGRRTVTWEMITVDATGQTGAPQPPIEQAVAVPGISTFVDEAHATVVRS